MEGDSEKTKISYLQHWINGYGITQIEAWKNNKILISQSEYDALEDKEGKYSSDHICDAAQVWGGPRATEHTKECLLLRRPGC